MKRTLCRALLMPAAFFLASCAGPRPPAPKPAPAAGGEAAAPAIEGTWRETTNENRPVTGKTWTFAGTKVVISDRGQTYAGTFTVDDSREPNEIDFAFEGYPVNQGIYLLAGDVLTLKVRDSAAERPARLGAEPGYTLIICNREKPAAAN